MKAELMQLIQLILGNWRLELFPREAGSPINPSTIHGQRSVDSDVAKARTRILCSNMKVMRLTVVRVVKPNLYPALG
ncbi:hypothetical protein TNCV_2276201 [Trichonephila clavipes]|nr:hypothetical protein TNCV_2276201 [Trichonephila clavipes]